jgi:hypothetical protein
MASSGHRRPLPIYSNYRIKYGFVLHCRMACVARFHLSVSVSLPFAAMWDSSVLAIASLEWLNRRQIKVKDKLE